MADFYTVSKISKNLEFTPEGYLLCKNVPVTKAGEFAYLQSENPYPDLFDGDVVFTRDMQELSKKDALDSIEGKPVTISHPEMPVNSLNWSEFAVGVVQNVRIGEGLGSDKIYADLLLTDQKAIDLVQSKKVREVSLSVQADVIKTGENTGNLINIRGNHLALAVKGGRCGPDCSINDEKGGEMSLKEKLTSAFKKALNDSMPDEEPPEMNVMDLIRSLTDRISMLEEKLGAANSVQDETETDTVDDEADGSNSQESDIIGRLSNIEAALLKLVGVEKAEEQLGDEQGGCLNDESTLSKAEILSAGIEKGKDLKMRALKDAYGTETGKRVIDSLLQGRLLDEAPDKDLLFIAASEMIKTEREGVNLNRTRSNVLTSGPMTAEKLNLINQKFYGDA